MTQFEIHDMTAAHVPQIAVLETRCFADPWSEGSVSSELDNPLSLWLVAERNGQVLGYIGSQTVLDEADVMNVAVDPDQRRQGIGKALLQALAARLRQNGVVAVTLEARPSNEPAVRLYLQEGFRQVGRRKNYYHNPTEDALILRKEWQP